MANTFYAVGGTVNIQKSNGFLSRKYFSSLKDSAIKSALVDVCSKEHLFNQIYLFDNKDDAVIFSEALKRKTKGKLYKAPIFEIELNNDYKFKATIEGSLLGVLDSELKNGDGEINSLQSLIRILKREIRTQKNQGPHDSKNIFNIVCEHANHKIKCYSVLNKPDKKEVSNFLNSLTIKNSYVKDYHNFKGAKCNAQYLDSEAKRKLFDKDTIIFFALTFWGFPLTYPGYLIYRTIKQYTAQKKLTHCRKFDQFSTIWKDRTPRNQREVNYKISDNAGEKIQEISETDTITDSQPFIFDGYKKGYGAIPNNSKISQPQISTENEESSLLTQEGLKF